MSDAPLQPLPTSVETMHKVSPKLMWPQLVSNAIWTLIVCGGLYLCYREWGWGFLIPLGIFGVFFIWRFFLIPFQVRNMGWLETDNELVLSKGKMFHTITVIPYGRIQFVDVESGPISRSLGLKELKVHTASSSSDSDLPGLIAEDADALRPVVDGHGEVEQRNRGQCQHERPNAKTSACARSRGRRRGPSRRSR